MGAELEALPEAWAALCAELSAEDPALFAQPRVAALGERLRRSAEAVSARAVAIGGLNYKSIASLLSLSKTANPGSSATADTKPAAIVDHVNLRGPGYFH